ncbi:hypothetical protein AADQ00_05830 [Escherichia coli]|uniref:hypothetical protein n=1 Tax=Enterobacteriaceae TaxID=543 RepID=UPI00053BBAAC|nr:MULTISPECIES: hypothetical protein [Enterobacteriaceae]HCJ7771026.1 hypothetical protein [Citrobacter freundii]EFC1824553.1 hypothetical protein [Escherichia coli]EFF2199018.1 hypothetical protein [Escherichia coli]EFJ2250080.1 hypothetical protein [Escherichia coli]EKW6536014.1 hypothetical protein [Escherichia coli]
MTEIEIKKLLLDGKTEFSNDELESLRDIMPIIVRQSEKIIRPLTEEPDLTAVDPRPVDIILSKRVQDDFIKRAIQVVLDDEFIAFLGTNAQARKFFADIMTGEI